MTTPGKMLHHMPKDDPKPIYFPELDSLEVLKSLLNHTIHFPDLPEISATILKSSYSRIPDVKCHIYNSISKFRDWFNLWNPGNTTYDDIFVVEHNTTIGHLRKIIGPKSLQHIISVVGREMTVSEFKSQPQYRETAKNICYRVLSDPGHPLPGDPSFSGIKDHYSTKWIGQGSEKACLYIRGMFNHVFNATHDFISGSYDPAFTLWYAFFGIIPIVSIDLTKLNQLPPEQSCYAWDICKNRDLVNTVFPPNCMPRSWAKSNSEILFEPLIPPQVVTDVRNVERLKVTTLRRVVLETVPNAESRFPQDVMDLVFTGRLEGKTAPIQCSYNNNLFCVKKGKGSPHLESASLGNPSPVSSASPVSEFSAALLYHKMGVLIPSCAIYYISAEMDGFTEVSVLFVTEWLNGIHPKETPISARNHAIADVLIVNFEAMGIKNSNIIELVEEDPRGYALGVYRIDYGAALRFMANGELKNPKARLYYPSRDIKTITSAIVQGYNKRTKIVKSSKKFENTFPALFTHSKYKCMLQSAYVCFISLFDGLSNQDLFDQLLSIRGANVMTSCIEWCKTQNITDSQIFDNIGIFKVRFTELYNHMKILNTEQLKFTIQYSKSKVMGANRAKRYYKSKYWKKYSKNNYGYATDDYHDDDLATDDYHDDLANDLAELEETQNFNRFEDSHPTDNYNEHEYAINDDTFQNDYSESDFSIFDASKGYPPNNPQFSHQPASSSTPVLNRSLTVPISDSQKSFSEDPVSPKTYTSSKYQKYKPSSNTTPKYKFKKYQTQKYSKSYSKTPKTQKKSFGNQPNSKPTFRRTQSAKKTFYKPKKAYYPKNTYKPMKNPDDGFADLLAEFLD